MKVDWLHDPVIQVAILGALLGIGLMGSLALWISTSTKARAARKAFQAFRVSTETALTDLTAKVEQLQTVPAPEVVSPAPMAVQGLNLTTRAKALRMHRRGETISTIAASLGVQQEEVDLLLKMDRLLETPTA
jgi:hypothetical protein